MKTTLSLSLATVATLFVATAAHAQQMPGNHPAYLHGLSDLRESGGLLERPTGAPVLKWDEHVAIKEIDAAIHEIKEAAIDDGKDLSDHPAIDTKLDWKGRLHASLKLLEKAHADTDQEEDNNFARGLKHRALEHIDRAAQMVRDGIAEVEAIKADAGEGDHPAYLHALTDLRTARAHLERPADVVVKWDEKKAIREIDAAIGEIKKASIDDNKPLDDHPPVDVALDWGGRLHRTLELVQKAHDDIDKREDNKWARGLKRRALGHLEMAARFINQGIANLHD